MVAASLAEFHCNVSRFQPPVYLFTPQTPPPPPHCRAAMHTVTGMTWCSGSVSRPKMSILAWGLRRLLQRRAKLWWYAPAPMSSMLVM